MQFVCQPMHGARLSPEACARRHQAAQGGPFKPGGGVCQGCAVGRAHSASQAPQTWPDGSPIVRLTVVPANPVAVYRAPKVVIPEVKGLLVTPAERDRKQRASKKRGLEAAARKLKERAARIPKERRPKLPRKPSGPRGKTYPYQGREMGAVELSKLPEVAARGLTWKTITMRMSRGFWTLEEALTLPLGAWPKRAYKYEWPYQGRMLTITDILALPEAAGCSKNTVASRLRRGFSVEQALSREALPKQKRHRDRRRLPYNGVEMTVAELLRLPHAAPGLSIQTFESRLDTLKWDVEKALTTPRGKYTRRAAEVA